MWTKRKWVNWMLCWLGYLWPWPLTLTIGLDLWPWIFKVRLYLGIGRPDYHGMKGTGVDRMPWCETLRKWVNWTLHWLGYLWLLPWIFKVKVYLLNGRADCHGTKWPVAGKMFPFHDVVIFVCVCPRTPSSGECVNVYRGSSSWQMNTLKTKHNLQGHFDLRSW